MNRRKFISSNAAGAVALAGYVSFPDILKDTSPGDKKSYAKYIRGSVLPIKSIDTFLNEDTWAQFDPEVGYILGNYMPHDGLDNSFTLSTVMDDGKRTNQVYADRPCRINTYGNSFTHCHQVSDSETWQEYLAGHLGEPVQNFGMGGFGVYQAYRRLLRRESVDKDSEYVILYMWGDDYVRSVFRCRYVTYYKTWDSAGGYMFHGNFWSNIEMDLPSGRLVEKANIIGNRDDLYKMSDPDFLYQSLKDDLMVQLHLLSRNMVNADVDTDGLKKLAEICELPEVDFSEPGRMMDTATNLKNKYSFLATREILRKTRTVTDRLGKKLLIVHFDPSGVFRPLVNGKARYDQEVIDFIIENKYKYFDMNEVHMADFKQFNLPLDEYMKRYFIGHYKPAGNHFFAYAIKDTLVDWLDPKPITYQIDDSKLIRFKGYLPD
jgi:hypothetical protein